MKKGGYLCVQADRLEKIILGTIAENNEHQESRCNSWHYNTGEAK